MIHCHSSSCIQVSSLQSSVDAALDRIAELEHIHRSGGGGFCHAAAAATSKVFRDPGTDGGDEFSPTHTAATPLLQHHRQPRRSVRQDYDGNCR